MVLYNEKKVFFVVYCILFYSSVNLYAGGKGTSGAQFLDIEVGARAMGVGGAFVGLADDAEGIYYNPASQAFFLRKNILIHHDSRFFDNQFNYFAYSSPLKEKHGLSLNFTYQDAGNFEAYDIANRRMGSFDARDYALGFGYGYRLNKSFGVGANLKFIRSTIASYDAEAIGLDAGLLFRFNEKLSIGASLRNIGSGIRFIRQKDDLPLNFQAGIGYTPFKNWNILFDINKSIDDDKFRIHLGTEYWFLGRYGIRVGYRDVDDMGGDVDGLTAGLGLRFFIEEPDKRARREFYAGEPSLNYAYIPQGDFGKSHILSLSFAFGKIRGAVDKIKKEKEARLRTPEEIQTEKENYVKKEKFKGKLIAVLDFRNTLEEDGYEWLRKALRDIIVSKLQNKYTILERKKVKEVAELVDLAGIQLKTDEDFLQFGRFLEVDGFIAGAFAVEADIIHLEVGIYDVKSSVVRDSFMVKEKVEDVFNIGENLAKRVERSLK
ncbi:MAG: PorV/PorQ family protein [Candidatus Hydrogenedentota bacterium]